MIQAGQSSPCGNTQSEPRNLSVVDDHLMDNTIVSSLSNVSFCVFISLCDNSGAWNSRHEHIRDTLWRGDVFVLVRTQPSVSQRAVWVFHAMPSLRHRTSVAHDSLLRGACSIGEDSHGNSAPLRHVRIRGCDRAARSARCQNRFVVTTWFPRVETHARTSSAWEGRRLAKARSGLDCIIGSSQHGTYLQPLSIASCWLLLMLEKVRGESVELFQWF